MGCFRGRPAQDFDAGFLPSPLVSLDGRDTDQHKADVAFYTDSGGRIKVEQLDSGGHVRGFV